MTAQGAPIIFFDDLDVNGSAFVLNGFDGVSLLSGQNDQGSFSAPYDGSTVFRKAQLDKYQPTDPCREAAAIYNATGSTSGAGFNAALAGLVVNGCHARIIIEVPPNPIRVRSFRPIAPLQPSPPPI